MTQKKINYFLKLYHQVVKKEFKKFRFKCDNGHFNQKKGAIFKVVISKPKLKLAFKYQYEFYFRVYGILVSILCGAQSLIYMYKAIDMYMQQEICFLVSMSSYSSQTYLYNLLNERSLHLGQIYWIALIKVFFPYPSSSEAYLKNTHLLLRFIEW